MQERKAAPAMRGGFSFYELTKKKRCVPIRGAQRFFYLKMYQLDFRHGNCFLVTNFDTTLTPEALLGIHWFGFSVHYFIDINRANLDTLFTSFTLVFVHYDFITHLHIPTR